MELRVLKPEVQYDVDDFIAGGGHDHGCQCSVCGNPPCSWCEHPGNDSYIDEHDELWWDAGKLLESWLTTYTCHRYKKCREIFWRSGDGRFVILKHNSHYSYSNFGVQHMCNVYYSLYDLENVRIDPSGTKHLKKWKGRFLERFWDECMDAIQKAI